MLDIEALLVDVSEEFPCGDDLEYDPLFTEMERAKEGTDGSQMGGSVKEAEPPDWRLVEKNALLLMKKTRDVRVATNLTLAMLHTNGFQGLEEATALLFSLLEKHWVCIYPEQDPYDDYPIGRINAINELGHGSFINFLKKQPIVQAKGLGSFSLYDVERSKESVGKKDEKTPDMSLIDATFQACDLDDLSATSKNIANVVANFTKINTVLQEHVAENASDFSNTRRALQSINTLVATHLTARGGDASSVEAEEGVNTVSGSSAVAAYQATAGEITNRNDVIDALDDICKYYRKYEPGSPILLLLERSKRLVDKNFIELMQDLSPTSIKELVKALGAEK